MGTIVGGFAMPHILMEPDGIEEQAQRVFDAMKVVRDRVQALAPDRLVFVSNDHLTNFSLACQVPFGIGTAEEYVPYGEMDIPKTPFRGDAEFSERFLRYSRKSGFDVAQIQGITPDHGMSLPNIILNKKLNLPVTPIFIGTNNTIPPTLARVWAFGQLLGRMVNESENDERVVVVALGGMSHFMCEPEHGRINEEFDLKIIELIISGNGKDLTQYTTDELASQIGISGLECINCNKMEAYMDSQECVGEKIFYEAVPKWITGMGMIALSPRT